MMNISSLSSFFLTRFESPLFLLLIPILLLLLLLKRRDIFFVHSARSFSLIRGSWVKRAAERIGFYAPFFLLLLGELCAIIALAQPRSIEYKTETRTTKGRITILVNDGSGSMAGTVEGSSASKLGMLKKANAAFLDRYCEQKGSGDLSLNLVGLVEFRGSAKVRELPTKDCRLIRRRLELMEADGGTSIEDGLWAGLALLIAKADHGRIISPDELKMVTASLREKTLLLPKRRHEFCEHYHGLALLLFTDGEFARGFNSPEEVLRSIEELPGTGRTNPYLNPFHVITLAKSLCVKTYFWSVAEVPPAYEHAFSSPPGTGFAFGMAQLGEDDLQRSYKEVAEREIGELFEERLEIYNPRMRFFVAASLLFLGIGSFLGWLKRFSHHYGKERAE